MQVCVKTFVALVHKPNDTFGGLKVYADDTQVKKKRTSHDPIEQWFVVRLKV